MATFTIELWKVMEIEGDTGNGFRIGLSDYPIFDPNYRVALNQKITDHFYHREIGLETISYWTFNLRRKMNEIMPYWNQIYKSTQIQFDPLATFNLATVRDGTANETNTSNTTANNSGTTAATGRGVHSDFPQSQLSVDEDYATSADDSSSNSASTGTGVTNGTQNNAANTNETSTTKGFQGAASRLLMDYRASLINVDMAVIGELNELFMGVWDNGDEMLPSFTMGLGALGYGFGY